MANQRELMMEFKSYLAQAIHEDKLFDEVITWDAALNGMPNPQGGMMPVISIYMSIPGLILGEQVVTWNMMPANNPFNEEFVRAFYNEAKEALISARSKQAADALSGDQQSQPSGLVVPGR